MERVTMEFQARHPIRIFFGSPFLLASIPLHLVAGGFLTIVVLLALHSGPGPHSFSGKSVVFACGGLWALFMIVSYGGFLRIVSRTKIVLGEDFLEVTGGVLALFLRNKTVRWQYAEVKEVRFSEPPLRILKAPVAILNGLGGRKGWMQEVSEIHRGRITVVDAQGNETSFLHMNDAFGKKILNEIRQSMTAKGLPVT